MHNYESKHGSLPPVAVTDKDGKPLLSWRVAILPWIEQDELYQQFHLDEPWDSPHNLTLIDRMPATFKVRSRHVDQTQQTTYLQVFSGKGAPFELGRTVGLKSFTRGMSNTLLIVEAGEPVIWTKPEDLPYDRNRPLPKLGGVFPDVMRAVLADGSAQMFCKPFNESEIRAMITLD